MASPVLGSLGIRSFLRRHWQKRPLFLRGALPELRNLFDAGELRTLARREDVESRLVTCLKGRWNVDHGPFTKSRLDRPGAPLWSLLVQGVDTHLQKARDLLERFAFIPYSRLDDVMVSLAPPGGGVGPHFDSYDVFLLQVQGTRRWRIGAQTDLELIDAPLRILRDFRHEQEFVVEPGDLLYLPPHFAHDGVALSDCITCSIGFRAPERAELANAFLQWLPESLDLQGRYSDPDLAPARHPASISTAMVRQVGHILEGIRWNGTMVERFLGEHLTEPKQNTWFEAPRQPLGRRDFEKRIRQTGVHLDRKTRMLYRGRAVYVNGECFDVPPAAVAEVRTLADERRLMPRIRSSWWLKTLHDWYLAGYVQFGD